MAITRPDPMRFVESPRAASPARRRAAFRKAARSGAPAHRPESPRRPSAGAGSDHLPEWRELSESNDRAPGARAERWTLLDAIPTFRMAAAILAFCVVTTLYVGHVLATQNLMARAESLRRENLALHLRSNRVKGAFDRATGPSVIYDRARALGLTQQLPNGPIIQVD